jgi:hypothetical protein
LRKGLLPHAFQSSGKGSSWKIPHSSKQLSISSNYTPPQLTNKTFTVKSKLKVSATVDTSELKKQLENARLKFKPNRVKYLLIAEAPPDSIDRFFYYTDVFKHDDCKHPASYRLQQSDPLLSCHV